MKITTFEQLNLSEEMQRAIADMGFTKPSEIQAEAIPLLLEGHDLIGQAQTGTGKTAAFGIPVLETISSKSRFVEALVMCPTRELAVQVCEELKKLAKHKPHLSFVTIYGGESIQKQLTALKKGVQVVVGTPGRIMDHMRRKTLSLSKVKMIVLDEADEMLNMGFREDIELIMQDMPEERQTILFSATMPKPILELTKRYQNSPKIIKVTKNEMTVAAIEQVYFETSNAQKINLMARLIDIYDLKLGLIFCNTKRVVDEIVKKLQDLHYKAEAIHGDLKQSQRNTVLAKFRNSEINFLVATDVAARGIDVKDVDVVFNYDLPLDIEYYVHRIGRTGRAGKSGKAYSFITGRNEMRRLSAIEKATNGRIILQKSPTEEFRRKAKWDKFFEDLRQTTQHADLSEYEAILNQLETEGMSLKEISAVLLHKLIGKTLMKLDKTPISAEKEEGFDREKRPGKNSYDKNFSSRDRNHTPGRKKEFTRRDDRPKREGGSSSFGRSGKPSGGSSRPAYGQSFGKSKRNNKK